MTIVIYAFVDTIYPVWWDTILSSGLSGDQYWQAATSASGSGYNDGLGIR
jgi:hypothetical protein